MRQWLQKLYDKTLFWSQHKHAPRYLAAVSFVEASVFPIPPYFMLAPMALAKPHKSWQYALIATVSSVCGGVLGYSLGYLVSDYLPSYDLVVQKLQEQGFWAVLIAGFTPVPFKIVAIASGIVHIPIWAFLLGSILGRGIKFYTVAGVVRVGGNKFSHIMNKLLSKKQTL